ncbi:hypothetical protein [Gordonia sp. NPDC003950]
MIDAEAIGAETIDAETADTEAEAAQSDPVEPRRPDQRDRPDAAGGERSDEPGVTGAGELEDAHGSPDVEVTADPDDPGTAGTMHASSARIRVRGTVTDGQVALRGLDSRLALGARHGSSDGEVLDQRSAGRSGHSLLVLPQLLRDLLVDLHQARL